MKRRTPSNAILKIKAHSEKRQEREIMSLPDLLKGVNSTEIPEKTSTPLLLVSSTHERGGEPCKPKKIPLRETMSAGGGAGYGGGLGPGNTIGTLNSAITDFDWDSDSVSSLDEGEAAWDALGRMNSIRRSNRFDKPHLLTVELKRSADGFGLELEGRSPPTIHAVCKCQ